MNVLVVLIPVSLALGLLGLLAFVWTLRGQQYDDPDGAAARILLDEVAGPRTAAPLQVGQPIAPPTEDRSPSSDQDARRRHS